MALANLARRRDCADEAARRARPGLLGVGAAAARRRARAGNVGRGALRTRVHGDFHLGQVLVVQGDVLHDRFRGRAGAADRRAAAKGTARCATWPACCAASTTPPPRPPQGRAAASPGTEERRATLLERFRLQVARRFLASYRAVLRAAPGRWVPEAAEADLVNLFLLEKAAYEVRYEAPTGRTGSAFRCAGLQEIAARVLVAEPAQ